VFHAKKIHNKFAPGAGMSITFQTALAPNPTAIWLFIFNGLNMEIITRSWEKVGPGAEKTRDSGT